MSENKTDDKQEKQPEPTDREEVKRILQRACDRTWKDETLYQTAVIASNAIYWRDREIENLRRQLERDVIYWRDLYDRREAQLKSTEAALSARGESRGTCPKCGTVLVLRQSQTNDIGEKSR